MLVVGKETNTLSTLHRIANCVKNRARKIVSSIWASRSLQCRPHLLSVKFENLVHRFSRNENSNLEINVSRFELLCWQQWQPPASTPGFSLLLDILGNMCIVTICYSLCDVTNFEAKLSFFIKPFSYKTSKVRTKTEIFQEWKYFSTWNKSHFSSFLKGLHWSKQNQFFWKLRPRL